MFGERNVTRIVLMFNQPALTRRVGMPAIPLSAADAAAATQFRLGFATAANLASGSRCFLQMLG